MLMFVFGNVCLLSLLMFVSRCNVPLPLSPVDGAGLRYKFLLFRLPASWPGWQNQLYMSTRLPKLWAGWLSQQFILLRTEIYKLFRWKATSDSYSSTRGPDGPPIFYALMGHFYSVFVCDIMFAFIFHIHRSFLTGLVSSPEISISLSHFGQIWR